jgi:hypothetical protein
VRPAPSSCSRGRRRYTRAGTQTTPLRPPNEHRFAPILKQHRSVAPDAHGRSFTNAIAAAVRRDPAGSGGRQGLRSENATSRTFRNRQSLTMRDWYVRMIPPTYGISKVMRTTRNRCVFGLYLRHYGAGMPRDGMALVRRLNRKA